MKLKVAQVVGLNTDQKASQAIYTIGDQDNAFFALLDLTCDDAFTKGRQTLSELSDFYFDLEGSASEKLTQTFQEADKKLVQASFNLSLASISGKVLYLIGKGEISVFLKRAGQLSPLLSSGSSQLISGFLEEGDRLLFATKSLVDFIGDNLSKNLDLDVELFAEEVTPPQEGLAGLFVEVVKEEVMEEEILPLSDGKIVENYSAADKLSADRLSKVNIKNVLQAGLVKLVALRAYFPKSNRGRLILGCILILILAAGLSYKIKLSKDQQKNAQFNKNLQQARDDFNSAKGLSTLNPKDAKVKLDQAKDKVNQALSLKPTSSEALDLKKQIENDSAEILKQASVSEFPLFLDLDLVKKNFRADKLSLSSGKLLVMDPAVKTLVLIDLAKKSHQILAGEEQLGDAASFSLNGGLAFIYSKNKGVLRIDATNQKLTTVFKKDDNLGQIVDLYGFAGNIYLLDSTKNKIWKYLPTSDGYSDARDYLAPEVKVDLSNALRMQIEASVYVLQKGGEILRFTRGVKDNFGLEGLDKGIKDPKSFFVSSDTDNLYILDSGNSRLLILTKTGAYKGQISGDKFGSTADLVVDEAGKKVYLLEGSKIYMVDLK